MYTSHPTKPLVASGQPGFVMTQIKAWCMTGDADTFRQGAAAFRNGRDWAKRERDRVIDEANERIARGQIASTEDGLGLSFESEVSGAETIITSQETVLHPNRNNSPTCESETSADELSLDFRPQVKRTKSPQKKPKT